MIIESLHLVFLNVIVTVLLTVVISPEPVANSVHVRPSVPLLRYTLKIYRRFILTGLTRLMVDRHPKVLMVRSRSICCRFYR
jgi:hypothetical protein